MKDGAATTRGTEEQLSNEVFIRIDRRQREKDSSDGDSTSNNLLHMPLQTPSLSTQLNNPTIFTNEPHTFSLQIPPTSSNTHSSTPARYALNRRFPSEFQTRPDRKSVV